MPVRAQLRHPAQQLEIHPLVDDTEESKARMRNGRLIVRIRLFYPATREVVQVHAARERMDIRMAVPLALVERMTAGEDDVSPCEQFLFSLSHRSRRARERRELVHAVVHHRPRCEAARELDRHRRVVPEHVVANAVLTKKVAQQPRLDRHGFRRRARGETRHDDVDAMLAHRHVEPRGSVVDHGLLDDEDAVQPRASGQQVLRPLEDEIPPEVGQGHDVRWLMNLE